VGRLSDMRPRLCAVLRRAFFAANSEQDYNVPLGGSWPVALALNWSIQKVPPEAGSS
jgi:hypothetical protein